LFALFATALSGTGAGVAVSTPLDFQDPTEDQCSFFNGISAYWPYSHNTTVLLSNASISNNYAGGKSSSGGGLSIGFGGAVTIRNSWIVNNSAALFGGGILLGGTQQSTCGVLMHGTVIANNRASHGGSQLYSTCAGDVLTRNVSVGMQISESEVGQRFALQPLCVLWLFE
jgi:hypothetical protein